MFSFLYDLFCNILNTLFLPIDYLVFGTDRYTVRFAFLKPIKDYVEQAREVLCAYTDYPEPTPPYYTLEKYCTKCPGTALYWCVDCNTKLCPVCTAHLHHPGKYAEVHSIEEIKADEFQGIRIVQPILCNALVFLTGWYLLQYLQVSQEYLASFDQCPSVTVVMSWISYMDTKIFYYMKPTLLASCAIEDSFYKLFIDTWIRGILVGSDDTLLVLVTFPSALIFAQLVVVQFIVPVVATLYALCCAAAHVLDSFIPRNEHTQTVELMLSYVDIVAQCSGVVTIPPMTKWRIRDRLDYIDLIKYWIGRQLRYADWYYRSTAESLGYWCNTALSAVVAFRLYLIWANPFLGIDVARIIRKLAGLVGFRETIKKQLKWFSTDSQDIVRDDLVINLARRFLRGLRRHIPFSNIPYLVYLVPIVLFGCLIGLVCFLAAERVRFNNDLDDKRAEYVGPCDSDAGSPTCACASSEFFKKRALQKSGKQD
eukprot:TRINITY_DN47295_c0_g1_i1.p1 TRINITY_DN47295_c0_g1~~TRINITY_DN47295_c0_g1_i1.p1  ORF type:complete len:482 (-),score=88.35 TRINITY_DN47295_c0_g1_i1:110-1555(-)